MDGEWNSYNFMSGGPESGESYPDTADGELDEEYDEEMLDENFKQQKTQILEMFNRISRF
jgi:hypothetical protein